MALPAGVVGSMPALLAVFTGSLQWWCMLPMLAIPRAARVVPAGERASKADGHPYIPRSRRPAGSCAGARLGHRRNSRILLSRGQHS